MKAAFRQSGQDVFPLFKLVHASQYNPSHFQQEVAGLEDAKNQQDASVFLHHLDLLAVA